MQFLQLLVQLSGFFEFCSQITATELEAPVEADGEGEEGDDDQRFQIVAQRELVALDHAAHHKMAIEADEQRHQRCVDTLKTEIATDDIADATVVGARHMDNVSQNNFR